MDRGRERERDHLGVTPESPLQCLSSSSLQIEALSSGTETDCSADS